MNGIANARELGDADRLCNGARSLPHCDLQDGGTHEKERPQWAVGEGVKGSSRGPCTRTPMNVSEHRAGLDSIVSWLKWLLSVLCTSLLLSYLSKRTIPMSLASVGQPPHRLPRRSTCETGKAQPDYDLPFHVGGLFIILFVSGTACAFPILVLKFPRLRIPTSFLFGAKHFGTGVLIATAFVHLLPTAFLSLSDPCLSSFWTTDYPAMPGAIMLASIFFVTIIEMVFSPAQHMCGGNEGVSAVSRETRVKKKEMEHVEAPMITRSSPDVMRRTYSDGSMQVREIGLLHGRVGSISRTLSRYREDNARLDSIESAGSETATPDEEGKSAHEECAIAEDPEKVSHDHVLTSEQEHQKAVMQCFLLEMGILFHSIFIGMSLAVAVGNDFVVLLIAIIFHQTFEGLALGVRIADIKWPDRAWQPWIMAVAYGCTTPLGQAIGIATHTLYSPNSEVGLLVVGIMNAVSAGFLVYASLVELMLEDFLSDKSWQILVGKKRVIACVLVFFGAFLMSLVGAWA